MCHFVFVTRAFHIESCTKTALWGFVMKFIIKSYQILQITRSHECLIWRRLSPGHLCNTIKQFSFESDHPEFRGNTGLSRPEPVFSSFVSCGTSVFFVRDDDVLGLPTFNILMGSRWEEFSVEGKTLGT